MKKSFISQWFTLVELIVVITILAILATIWYISIIWYSLTARDTTRIADVASIVKVIELYKTQSWTFPPVTNPISVTFSGSAIWEQWSFWEDSRRAISRISDIPIDPLTWNQYAYSKTNATWEYQVGTIVEKYESVSFAPTLISQSYASNLLKNFATTLIKWNYNGKFITHFEGSDVYILGAPSILANIIVTSTLEQIHSDESFVYQWWLAAPSTYSWSVQPLWSWDIALTSVTSEDHLIYTGSVSELNTESWKLNLIWNIQEYYNSSDVADSQGYVDLIDIDTINEPNAAISLVNTYIRVEHGWLSNTLLQITKVDIDEDVPSTWTPCIFNEENFDQCDFW